MRFPSLALVLVFLLAACSTPSGDESPSPADSDSPPPSQPAPSSAPPSEASQPAETPVPSASQQPVPSDALGEFTSDLPIVEDASVAVANIVDVRVGTHAGYDRVVFEFDQGTPELTLGRADPPFTADGSGLPVDVDGSSFLALVMRGGTRQTDEGTSSYDGPTDFDPGFPVLVDLVEGGDFERQSTWYLGLEEEACVRVLLLSNPYRLVIDVEQ